MEKQMAIGLGAHKPTIKLIRQFVGKDEYGREFSHSRYTIKALCSACNKPISRDFWAVLVNGTRRYYHHQCVKIEEPE